ncbi:protein translocase subunit SecD [Coleofasciculus sp. FACHB-SPT9]|uniref:protein translocase subunit SecD n=1 Tax=Cyanophyceae TaxID=3028117 RepID=UPI0016863CF7|nr:protein translocase subunit SecD [Coleofasciculus sp. FACHB-SPT9]MBD1891273.1 protein translocase subunit SecD [Coleofasciculus sp. FACHB-SPT9]
MQRQRSLLALILVLVIASITVLARIPIRLGLDLQGGSQLTLQVKPTEGKEITREDLEAVQKVVENRINGLGVSEAIVQTVGQDQVLVQLPGVSDPEQAERVLGGTAQLDFREQKPGSETQLQIEQQLRRELKAKQEELRKTKDEAAIAKNQEALQRSNQAIAALFERTNPPLTGKNLTGATARPFQTSDNWSVNISFDAEGGGRFAQLTKNIAGTGRTLGIFLDEELLSAATVEVKYAQEGISGGGAEITGNFSLEEANELVVQLRGGALPYPVEIIENRTVGATLGRDSIQSSIYASIGGLILVLIFIGVYYRLPGAIAGIALVIYSLLCLSAFVLLGVTLTLPGIAGFILSIGMAVDANVLIFERTREELRAGKSLYRSVESGFYRAFSSILDGNVTTLIACGFMFWLGSGLVKGFALTLAIGVLVSMFTAITCSRTLLMTAISFPELRKPQWFCPNLQASRKSEPEVGS